MFSKKINILIILATSTLFLFMASYAQPAETNKNLEDQNLFIPIIVAVISAGVSIFSIFRNEANTKTSREHEKNLAESLKEHEKNLAESKQKHDEWQTSITDVRERELDEARRKHDIKLAAWKAERERELEEAKRADQGLFEQWRIERESKLLEEKALRDYQYEARKRLYEEFEPLLFQFNELSESAFRRILAFVREAKEGNLVPWLSSIDGYYMKNTIYRLLAPLAVFRLMQNRLTLFDLNLDTCIKVQYLLIKALYHTFSNDFKLAKSEPSLPYDPHKITDHGTANKSEMLQGIFLGVLDQLVDAFIKEESMSENSKKRSRIINYGEFESIYSGLKSSGKLTPIIRLLSDFHPKTKPVLWRILVAQAHIYKATTTLNERAMGSCENIKPLKIISLQERKTLFDWRQPGENTTNEEVFEKPFAAVQHYLSDSVYVGKLLETSASEISKKGSPM